jgi:poly-beta-1,6-N-acetyl-D-glucosamine synthase
MHVLPTYVVVTPARNEAHYIELTIRSMIAQTYQPRKWVIVSDGSTDGTDEIVRRYAAEYPWIELLRMPERRERHFAGKVHAFFAGYERMREVSYEVIASLDGDVTFDAEYFFFLLQKLAEDPGLGVVGTPFHEGGRPAYDYRFVNIEHVSGICQVFRRECFEAIGGYLPLKGGGIDYVAVLSARMKGWKTRTFTEKACDHHRCIGTAENALLTARFKTGEKDYVLGGHPAWMLFRTAYQMTKAPLILGGLALVAGYCWVWLKRAERPVSPEWIAFRRKEEMQRLKAFIRQRDASGTMQRPVETA